MRLCIPIPWTTSTERRTFKPDFPQGRSGRVQKQASVHNAVIMGFWSSFERWVDASGRRGFRTV